jgi:malonate transporter MadM subunit
MTENLESIVAAKGLLSKQGLIFSFLMVGLIMWVSYNMLSKLMKNKLHGSAIAIVIALILAYVGGVVAGPSGKKGIADIAMFSGMALMGGAMFRDFAIMSTAYGADLGELKKAGLAGVLAMVLGTAIAFYVGAAVAYAFGYTDPVSMTTIGAGAVTFIVGPVTGAALQASSDVVALSIAAGVIKSILVMIATPMVAPFVGLNNPSAAVVFGGAMGTTSGVAAGLAATDPKLVPYGAMVATFYTGFGCLVCPSILFLTIKLFFGS